MSCPHRRQLAVEHGFNVWLAQRSARSCSRRTPPRELDVPMLPPAPPCSRLPPSGRGWRESWSGDQALTVSVPPPGANGTIQRMGLVGQAS